MRESGRTAAGARGRAADLHSDATLPSDRPSRAGDGHRGTHAHLWTLPGGTGLHAPYGQLVRDPTTGRVCCHLCGRWFRSLGSHLRRHGLSATSYREAVGLCRTGR